MDPANFRLVVTVKDYPVDPFRHEFHFRLLQASAGNCRSADPDPTGDKSVLRIKWNGILIDCQTGSLQKFFSILAGDILVGQIYEQQVIVRPTGDQIVVMMIKCSSKGLGIFYNLFLVRLIFWL